jgi:hypothetical protein
LPTYGSNLLLTYANDRACPIRDKTCERILEIYAYHTLGLRVCTKYLKENASHPQRRRENKRKCMESCNTKLRPCLVENTREILQDPQDRKGRRESDVPKLPNPSPAHGVPRNSQAQHTWDISCYRTENQNAIVKMVASDRISAQYSAEQDSWKYEHPFQYPITYYVRHGSLHQHLRCQLLRTHIAFEVYEPPQQTQNREWKSRKPRAGFVSTRDRKCHTQGV